MLNNLEQVFLVVRGLGGMLRSTLLNDELVELELLRGSFNDSFLDRVLRDESEHIDLLRLTDTMRSVHCLEIRLRVPIAVVQYNNVGSDHVDSQTTCTSGK